MQPDVLQRGRAVLACQRSKSQDVRAATWNVSSMLGLSGKILTLYTEERLTSVVFHL